MAGTAAGYPISTTPDVIRQFSDRPTPEMLDAIERDRGRIRPHFNPD